MAADQMMTGPNGEKVRCFRRAARNVQTGDYFPEYGARVVAAPLTDPETGRHWVTLEDGQDVEFTPRGKVWLFREYAAPEWMADALADYRAARDARDAMRESSAPVPTSVAGANGSNVSCSQLEDDDFNRAFPAPRLADFIRAAADSRRSVSA